MEKKHTPGPWRLNDSLHAHVLSDNYHVVDAGRGFHKDGQFGKGFSVAAFMSISDARLIAAAPELLASLEAVLPLVKHTDDAGWDVMKKARAIVEKANGR